MRRLKNLLIVLAAIVFAIEEWLWDRLTALTGWLGRLPLLRRLEKRIARLPPYGAMALLAVPAAMLFPFKIAALWAMARGYVTLGIIVILAAKIVGTAFVAHLFALCRPQMLQIRWFAALYHWVIRTKSWLYARLAAMPVYRRTRAVLRRVRSRLRTWMRRPDQA
jgi:hypothetical protein